MLPRRGPRRQEGEQKHLCEDAREPEREEDDKSLIDKDKDRLSGQKTQSYKGWAVYLRRETFLARDGYVSAASV